MLTREALETLLNDTQIYTQTGIRAMPSPQLLALGRTLERLQEDVQAARSPDMHLGDADRIILFVFDTCVNRSKIVDAEIVRRMQDGPHSP